MNPVIDWILSFFRLEDLTRIVRTASYPYLLTSDGILSIFAPLVPTLMTLEIIKALVLGRFRALEYKIPFLSYVANELAGKLTRLAAVTLCIDRFTKYAPVRMPFTWYWLGYGYIVWEFGHFIYHYLSHKVRLLWCLHSTHHAPQAMNLSVSYAHFFLEAPYADFIRTTVSILLGVDPAMLFFIMFIDGLWGGFIHVGEHLLRDGRVGVLHSFILTPSHHRVHHARNPPYMDTNFCNLLNLWDRVFGTYQCELREVPIVYGITREMKPQGFLDAYFGEFWALAKDVSTAPGIKNKLLCIIMPPSWKAPS